VKTDMPTTSSAFTNSPLKFNGRPKSCQRSASSAGYPSPTRNYAELFNRGLPTIYQLITSQ
jgi:hypothetical protein